MLKFSDFGWGYLSSNGFGEQIDLHGFYDLSSSIDKVSLKKNSMSLGLVVLEKLFMRTWTPQSDAIMSADRKVSKYKNRNFKEKKSIKVFLKLNQCVKLK